MKALVVAAIAALSLIGAGAASARPALDGPGSNACYLFGKFAAEATTMTPAEIHSALKKVYFGAGGFGGRGAASSSNRVLRANARQMLEIEVSQGIGTAWLRAAT